MAEARELPDFVQLAEDNSPAVVNIGTSVKNDPKEPAPQLQIPDIPQAPDVVWSPGVGAKKQLEDAVLLIRRNYDASVANRNHDVIVRRRDGDFDVAAWR